MDRAYSLLSVKHLDEDARIIEGVATTPAIDRVGDVIDPLGVKFTNPSPLLWQHRPEQPVGLVNFERPTKAGVNFKATLPRIPESGVLRDRVEEAWSSVKSGLVRAVSIGFRPLDGATERLQSGGTRFKKVEVMELSLVTIPAQAEATITNIKFYDNELRGHSAPSSPSTIALPALSLRKKMEAQFGVDAMKGPARRGDVYDMFDLVTQSFQELKSRVASLEAGIVVGTQYRGVYQRQQSYEAGSLCTAKGSLWHCNSFAPAGAEPGTSPDVWTLCAKTAEPPRPQRDTAGQRIAAEPKRARKFERVVVTKHDGQGRILEFEKENVEQ